MRVAIYARVSRADADDPNSVPVQLADCRDGRPRGSGGRGGARRRGRLGVGHAEVGAAYRQLMEDVREGRVDAVLAREMERLLRQMKEGRDVITLYEEAGFHRLCFTLENIDLRRARDRKEFYDRVNSAEFYSAFLGEKIRRTTERKAAAASWQAAAEGPSATASSGRGRSGWCRSRARRRSSATPPVASSPAGPCTPSPATGTTGCGRWRRTPAAGGRSPTCAAC